MFQAKVLAKKVKGYKTAGTDGARGKATDGVSFARGSKGMSGEARPKAGNAGAWTRERGTIRGGRFATWLGFRRFESGIVLLSGLECETPNRRSLKIKAMQKVA
jgi:hypothetical protein